MTAHELGPVEGMPWVRIGILGDGLEVYCEVCRSSCSASAKALAKGTDALEREVLRHTHCDRSGQ